MALKKLFWSQDSKLKSHVSKKLFINGWIRQQNEISMNERAVCSSPPPVGLGHERTDKQEDQDGKNHHKRSVSIEGNRLDEPRFEDFIPSRL